MIYTFVRSLPALSLMLSTLPYTGEILCCAFFFFFLHPLAQLLNSLVGGGRNWDDIPERIHHLIAHLLTSKGMNFPSHPLLDCFVPPVSGNAARYLRCTAHSVLVNCSCCSNDSDSEQGGWSPGRLWRCHWWVCGTVLFFVLYFLRTVHS